jgi:hypothetical protein
MWHPFGESEGSILWARNQPQRDDICRVKASFNGQIRQMCINNNLFLRAIIPRSISIINKKIEISKLKEISDQNRI